MSRLWTAMADWFRRRFPKKSLGKRGERAAARHLKRQGYKIVATGTQLRPGELDIVAIDRGTIVFVEVKTRTGRTHVEPYAAVNAAKQIRYRRVAQHYMLTHEIGERTVRFDVVSIVLTPGQSPEIEHIPNAFA